ncbi:MAG TPA: hypothetical protein VK666_10630 [Chryseolinea sp.]|nr:hypothetical protein [Chryseolinea sp.]
MISVTGTTGNYILQPVLFAKHSETIDWLSSTVLWKSELNAFQTILDERAPSIKSIDGKKSIDHYQNLVIYYNGELIDTMRKKLRDHETSLAHMLESKNESDTHYYKEHQGIMDELESFSVHFKQFRAEFFEFMRTAH